MGAALRVGGDERRARQPRADQIGLSRSAGFTGERKAYHAIATSKRAGGECVVLQPLMDQPLHVNVADGHLRIESEPLRLGQHRAVLGDQRVPGPHQIGRGLARPGPGVEIGCQTARRLLAHQVAPVVHLPQQFVAGRPVDQHRRARQRHVAAGRTHRPQVLADLDPDHQPGRFSAAKSRSVPHGASSSPIRMRSRGSELPGVNQRSS